MKKAVFTLLVAVLTVGAMNASSQKLAYVNSQEILMNLPERQEAQDSITTMEKKLYKELQELQQYLEEKVQEYQTASQDPNVSKSKLQIMGEDIQNLDQRIQQRQQTAQQELEQLNQKLTKPLVEKVQSMIETVSKEEGYTYVFDQSTLVFAAENATNITDKVKKKLGITVSAEN